MRIKIFVTYMLGIYRSYWLLVLLLLRKKLLLLMLVMLKNRRMRGRYNGCDSGGGGRQLGLELCKKTYFKAGNFILGSISSTYLHKAFM